jgi:signal recognition particle subunit SRP54
MLDVLSDGFKSARDKFRGQTTLSEDNIDAALVEVRKSLLEADVEYGVAKTFLARVKEEALGKTVQLKAGKGDAKMRVSASDHFVQICQDELTKLMGPANSDLDFPANRPATIMMVGLQGSGKTTTTGKLTKYLMTKHKRKPLLVAADIYRPAAVEQLKVLGAKVGVPVFHIPGASAVEICKAAIPKAFELGRDTILFDTAGRLTIDATLMQELADIKSETKPDNILLVCDAMMGQDAVTTAKSFDEQLTLSGVVMTKLDGDARGGAALSIKEVTGKPIKFLGMGEDLDRLEEFRPEGLASRILGMGDVVGLMQDFERVSDRDREEDAMRMLQGQFSFRDFYEQLSMIQKMGPLKDIMAKLPMGGMMPKGMDFDDKELVKIKAMIDSMTEQERLNPKLFSNDGRIRRVAKGSGRPPKEVSELVKKFGAMRQMMGMLGKNMGLLGKIPGMGQISQMNNMRKMAQQMSQGAGAHAGARGGMGGGLGGMMPPGMGGLAGLFGGPGGGGGGAPMRSAADREKQKKMRKDAKKARKKNRKR